MAISLNEPIPSALPIHRLMLPIPCRHQTRRNPKLDHQLFDCHQELAMAYLSLSQLKLLSKIDKCTEIYCRYTIALSAQEKLLVLLFEEEDSVGENC